MLGYLPVCHVPQKSCWRLAQFAAFAFCCDENNVLAQTNKKREIDLIGRLNGLRSCWDCATSKCRIGAYGSRSRLIRSLMPVSFSDGLDVLHLRSGQSRPTRRVSHAVPIRLQQLRQALPSRNAHFLQDHQTQNRKRYTVLLSVIV